MLLLFSFELEDPSDVVEDSDPIEEEASRLCESLELTLAVSLELTLLVSSDGSALFRVVRFFIVYYFFKKNETENSCVVMVVMNRIRIDKRSSVMKELISK